MIVSEYVSEACATLDQSVATNITLPPGRWALSARKKGKSLKNPGQDRLTQAGTEFSVPIMYLMLHRDTAPQHATLGRVAPRRFSGKGVWVPRAQQPRSTRPQRAPGELFWEFPEARPTSADEENPVQRAT